MAKIIQKKKTGKKNRETAGYSTFMVTNAGLNINNNSPAETELIEKMRILRNSNPARAIKELLVLIEQYPHLRELHNFLYCAYDRIGEKKSQTVFHETELEAYVPCMATYWCKVGHFHQAASYATMLEEVNPEQAKAVYAAIEEKRASEQNFNDFLSDVSPATLREYDKWLEKKN